MAQRRTLETAVKDQPGNLADGEKAGWLSLMSRSIKEDQTAARAANTDGDMSIDVFADSSGIDSGLSSGFTVRGSPDFDVIASTGGSISLFRPGDISTGLQGFWKMDETSGNRSDSSANGNTLTDNNTVGSSDNDYWNTAEKSADFEAANTEFLTITDASQTGLDLNGTKFTICAWIRAESFGASSSMMFQHKSGSAGYEFRLESSGLVTLVKNNGGQFLTSITTLSIGVWYHLTMVYDQSFLSLYINGNLDKTVVDTTDSVNPTGDFFIGLNDGATTKLFDGLMKDAAIWNVALSPLQIKSLAMGTDLSSFALRPDDSSLTSPVSYWKLNEISSGAGAITRVDSVGSNDLTDNATTASGAGFMEGVGADLEKANNEFFNITDAASSSTLRLNGTKFTVACWLKPESLAGTQLFIGQTGGGAGWEFRIDTNTLTFVINAVGFSSTTVLTAGTWYHIAFTYDQTDAVIYIDGKADKTVAHVIDVSGSASDFIIGTNPGGGDKYDGLIADAAVWTVALTAANIASLASGLPIQNEGIISYYKMDESSGNAIDAIGSNDLTDNNTVGTATGQVGTGRDFEDTNTEGFSITDASQTGLDLIDDFTIMLWQNPETVANQKAHVAKHSGADGYIFRFNNATVTMGLVINGVGSVNASTAVSTGTFIHSAVTHDGATVQHYLDSVTDGSGTIVTPNDNVADFRVGENDPFDGIMDELLIAARWFREEEIKTAYIKGFNGKEVISSEISAAVTTTIVSTAFVLSESPTHAMMSPKLTLNTGTVTLYVSRVLSPGSTLTDITKWTLMSANTITDLTTWNAGTSARGDATITGNAEIDDMAVVWGRKAI